MAAEARRAGQPTGMKKEIIGPRGPHMTRQGHQEISRLLLDELTQAHAANQSARLRFDFVVKQASFGMPQH